MSTSISMAGTTNGENHEVREPQAISNFPKNSRMDIERCNFPTDCNSSDFGLEFRSIDVSSPSVVRLDSFCSQHEISRPAVLYTVWALVLRYFTGQNGIIFGLTSARDMENSHICRVNLDGKTTIIEVLRQLQNHAEERLPSYSSSWADQQSLPNSMPACQFNTAMVFEPPQGLNGKLSTSHITEQGRPKVRMPHAALIPGNETLRTDDCSDMY